MLIAATTAKTGQPTAVATSPQREERREVAGEGEQSEAGRRRCDEHADVLVREAGEHLVGRGA